METLLHNLSEVFAVSIIHSLWQCLLIYLVLRIVLGSVIRFSSAAKYNISVIALYYITLWFVYTLFEQAKRYSWKITTETAFTGQPHLPLITTLKHLVHANDRYEVTIEHYLPYITIIYVLGLIFHSLKLTSSWLQLQRLKQSIVASAQLQEKIIQLSVKLKLKKQVIVGYAERLDIPCVAGYLKPLIMLPLSLTTCLSAKEIEVILLHELAHVKRNDYLINLLQQIMSVIFFFNPFVYLINRMVNLERENSCDDIVMELTDEPLIYAQALLKIEQNNATQLPLALAATGKKYHLLNRIERIMKTKQPMTNIRHLVLAFTILIASTVSIAWFNPAIAAGKLSVKVLKPLELFSSNADTTRKTVKTRRVNKTAKHTNTDHKQAWVTRDGVTYYNYGMKDPKLDAMGKEMDEYGKKMTAYFNNSAYKKMQEDLEKDSKQIDEYYNSAAYKKLQDEMDKYGKDVNEYYNNPAYKDLERKLDEAGKKMDAYYNNPALKNLQEAQEKLGKDYEAAYGNNSEMENMGKQMDAMGKKISAYYDSPEFKKLNAGLEKKYGIPENHNYRDDSKDENYRQYEAELKQHIPAEIDALTQQLSKMGGQMSSRYNTPERKAKNAQMRAMGDSMRIAYNNPQVKQLKEEMHSLSEQMRSYTGNENIKKQQTELRKLGEQMHSYSGNPQVKKQQEDMHKLSEQIRSYTNNPEIKELQRKMKEKGEEMRAYTNTPEFKKKAEEWRKSMKFGWDKDESADVNVSASAAASAKQ